MKALYAPTEAKTKAVRDELRARGIKANVRKFNHCIRVVLPDYGRRPSSAIQVLSFMADAGFSFAGGTAPTSPDARYAWSHHDGRAQFFLYDIR